MLAKLRRRLTYANVVSSLCLFIVLGGTSYAVAAGSIDTREIKNNTIRSKDIRNNEVRGKDIGRGAVKSSDVEDGSLLAEDFKAGQLPAGPTGPQGATGASGDSLARDMSRSISVPDNAFPPVPVVLDQSSFGRLVVECSDSDNTAGKEVPHLALHFTNTSSTAVNLLRQISNDAPVIGYLHPGDQSGFASDATSSYRFHVARNGVHVIYEGFFQREGVNTAAARCEMVGVRRVVTP